MQEKDLQEKDENDTPPAPIGVGNTIITKFLL